MSWDTGDKCNVADDCEWAEQFTGATIWLTPIISAVIRKLCKDVKTEWQMLLTGEENKEGVYVTGYWIPKQEVTGATVTNLDCVDTKVIEERKIVCTIHSHSNMGVFFSGVDEKFTNNSLIKNHIVVNNDGQMKACMRYELPCKMTKFFDATVSVITENVESIEGFENITHKVHCQSVIKPYTHWSNDKSKVWDTDKRKIRGKNRKHHAIHKLGKQGQGLLHLG